MLLLLCVRKYYYIDFNMRYHYGLDTRFDQKQVNYGTYSSLY